MENPLIQILGATIGIFVSILTMFIKIRKEIQSHQKEIVEARLTEERRLHSLEKRIAIVEQQAQYTASMLNARLSEISQRLDLFYGFVCKQFSGCEYEGK